MMALCLETLQPCGEKRQHNGFCGYPRTIGVRDHEWVGVLGCDQLNVQRCATAGILLKELRGHEDRRLPSTWLHAPDCRCRTLTPPALPHDNSSTGDKPKKRDGWAAIVVALVVVLVVAPLLYVLSFGSVIWMAQSNRIDPTLKRELAVTYWPVVWTAEHDVPIIGPAIMKYIEFWVPTDEP